MSAARATVPAKAPAAARPVSRQLTAEREADQAGGAVATGWSFSSLAPTARAALGQAGRALDATTRGTMETAFGADLSAVRVHDDARAAEAAADAHASAFTVGQDVVFGRGRFAPSTSAGRELLAHELAHTIQQRGARTPAAAPVEAGSPLEESARAAAAGRAVGPLGVSDLALASAAASPDYFDDDELAQQIAKYAEKLKTPSYPSRSGDADWLERLKSAQKQRASFKQSQAAAAPKRTYKPASHKQTPAQARRTAVVEAEATAAHIEAQLIESDVEDKEEPAPVSMSLDEPGKKAKQKPAPVAKPKRAAPKTQSKFTPGGFTNADIYGETDATLKRLEEENAPPKDPRPFKDRMDEANRKAPYTLLPADYPDSVWNYGISRGLFAEKERNLVSDTLEAPRRERAHKELEHEKMMAAYNQQLEFENFRSNLNLAFIQGALMGGPRAPFIVQAGYAAYSGAETGRAIGQAIQTGDPVDIGNAVVPLAGGLALHGMTRGEPGVAPPEEPPAAPRVELEEVTPEQVRALYEAEPFAVKKNLSGSFHQLVWESLGGQGQAPPFFRAGRVMQVFEKVWPTDLAEINDPSELGPGGQLPPDPVATAPTLDDPRAPTQPGPPPEPEVPPQPVGPATMPSAPAAPLRAPRRGEPPPAVEASVDDAADAMRADPQRVHSSPSTDWHDQIWILSRGQGDIPPIFRSGRTYIVDVTRLTDAERAAIGL